MGNWSSDATLGSGLWDRARLTIHRARVEHPYEKNPSAAAVVMNVERNIDDEIEDDHLWLKVGAFEPGDAEGTFLLHDTQTPDIYDTPGSKKKKINNRSSYGKFLKSFEEVVGFGVLANNQAPDRAKYEIWDVLFWEGLILDVEMVEEEFEVDDNDNPGQKKKVTSRQPYVRGFIGKADGTPAAASAPAASAAPAANGSGGPIDETKATEIAKGAGSYVKYLETVTNAGVSETDRLASREFYTSVVGS